MNEILSIQRWKRFERLIGRSVVAFDLKRLNALEAAPFVRALAEARSAFSMAMPNGAIPDLPEDHTPEQKATQLEAIQALINRSVVARAKFFEALPDELIRRLFERAVRNVQLVLDGEDVKDGATLLEVADHQLLGAILNDLESMCSLSSDEGKDSGSRSTSGSESGGPSGPSDATSTASSDPKSTSTATETSPSEPSSTSPPA